MRRSRFVAGKATSRARRSTGRWRDSGTWAWFRSSLRARGTRGDRPGGRGWAPDPAEDCPQRRGPPRRSSRGVRVLLRDGPRADRLPAAPPRGDPSPDRGALLGRARPALPRGRRRPGRPSPGPPLRARRPFRLPAHPRPRPGGRAGDRLRRTVDEGDEGPSRDRFPAGASVGVAALRELNLSVTRPPAGGSNTPEGRKPFRSRPGGGRMPDFDVQTVELAAPFDVAFRYVADPGTLPEWTHAFRSVSAGRAIRMLWNSEDARDATQEMLIRIVTRLVNFRGASSFATWAYRVAANYLLTARKSRLEEQRYTFPRFGAELEEGLSDEAAPRGGADTALLLEEVK